LVEAYLCEAPLRWGIMSTGRVYHKYWWAWKGQPQDNLHLHFVFEIPSSIFQH
jgi:hypothetical protein